MLAHRLGASRDDLDGPHSVAQGLLDRRLHEDLATPRPRWSALMRTVTSISVAGSDGVVGKAARRGT